MGITPKSDAELKQQLGQAKLPEVFSTEHQVYTSPFNYENVTIENWYEYGDKGTEIAADKGTITIVEKKQIVAVTVVGSGCTPNGYVICEWWDEGESIEKLISDYNQLVKRQRVDNLNGTHPSIWTLLVMAQPPKWLVDKYPNLIDKKTSTLSMESVSEGEVTGVTDALKKLSMGFYEGFYLGLYENTAYFRVGPPYPHKITIRSGCKVPEDPGTCIERYPGDYTIRVIELTLIK